MTLYPANRKKNLEKIGRDSQAGQWRISTLFDPIREKKFLLFALKARSLAPFAPTVAPFRCDAAARIAPSRCATVVAATIDTDRVELLTEWFELLEPRALADNDIRGLFDHLLNSIAEFESHQFFVEGLSTAALGKNEEGEWMLLPPDTRFRSTRIHEIQQLMAQPIARGVSFTRRRPSATVTTRE